MKLLPLLLLITISVTRLGAKDAALSFIPDSFDSTAEVTDFAELLFAGGKVQILEVQGSDILVLEILGSGLPTIAILTYSSDGDGWALQGTWRPSSIERFDVKVTGDQVFAVGKKTRERWVIFSRK